MLVLTRKVGQQIVLPGCGVTINVIDAGKHRVRLGVAAPADVPVHRGELWERIRQPRESPLRERDKHLL
jgi:carbon storage regulator